MGSFSWMFADHANLQNLGIGKRGYLCCPDNQYLCTKDYDGYGIFEGKDVYDLVADWNRKYLSEHPDFAILRDTNRKDKELSPVSQAPWYAAYADLSKTREEVVECYKQATGMRYVEWRYIGIDIACYDEQNEKLCFPIKITKACKHSYDVLPASMGDSNQGCAGYSPYSIDSTVSRICNYKMEDVAPDKVTVDSRLIAQLGKTAEIKVQHPDGSCQVLFKCPFLDSRKTAMDAAVFEKLKKHVQRQLTAIQDEQAAKAVFESNEVGRFFLQHKNEVVWMYDMGSKPEVPPCAVQMRKPYSDSVGLLRLSTVSETPNKTYCIDSQYADLTICLFETEEECRASYATKKEKMKSFDEQKAQLLQEIENLKMEYLEKETKLLEKLQECEKEIRKVQKE